MTVSILAKYATILVLTFADGSRTGYTLLTHAECEDLLEEALTIVEEQSTLTLTMVQCIDTDVITVSPRPMKKPEGLK